MNESLIINKEVLMFEWDRVLLGYLLGVAGSMILCFLFVHFHLRFLADKYYQGYRVYIRYLTCGGRLTRVDSVFKLDDFLDNYSAWYSILASVIWPVGLPWFLFFMTKVEPRA